MVTPNVGNANPADPTALDPLSAEKMMLVAHGLSLMGHVAEPVEEQTADGVPVLRRPLDAELLVELVDEHRRGDDVVAVRKLEDLRLFHVVLVDDLADELFDEVL